MTANTQKVRSRGTLCVFEVIKMSSGHHPDGKKNHLNPLYSDLSKKELSGRIRRSSKKEINEAIGQIGKNDPPEYILEWLDEWDD